VKSDEIGSIGLDSKDRAPCATETADSIERPSSPWMMPRRRGWTERKRHGKPAPLV
jgi:hypothetical protein